MIAGAAIALIAKTIAATINKTKMIDSTGAACQHA